MNYSRGFTWKYHDLKGYVLSSSWTGILSQEERENNLCDKLSENAINNNALLKLRTAKKVFDKQSE